jgi:hypothetical protein
VKEKQQIIVAIPDCALTHHCGLNGGFPNQNTSGLPCRFPDFELPIQEVVSDLIPDSSIDRLQKTSVCDVKSLVKAHIDQCPLVIFVAWYHLGPARTSIHDE